ncbi:Bidirectional sugar transporter SWEET17 [Camellia lanceoleosa]|nr:Bidirectional sugar transporter SWEET17 [Camellia lanceoleosa]
MFSWVEHRSTEEFESFPYICTLVSSSLWTYYGITKPGSYLVATVNGFGVEVEVIYASLFLLYAPPRMRAKTATLAGILNLGLPVAAILVTYLRMQGDMRIDVIGFMCAGQNIVTHGLLVCWIVIYLLLCSVMAADAMD